MDFGVIAFIIFYVVLMVVIHKSTKHLSKEEKERLADDIARLNSYSDISRMRWK